MHLRVWLAANTLFYAEGGGYLWIYLNWILGLRSVGCDAVWLEGVDDDLGVDKIRSCAAQLRRRLEPYGLADRIALCSKSDKPLPPEATAGYLAAGRRRVARDLLLNLSYEPLPLLAGKFRRSALVDIDPGLLQVWIGSGAIQLPPQDAYFTIGENVGRPGSLIPTAGFSWQYTPPCVALDWWPVSKSTADAAYTTVTHWFGGHWFLSGDESYDNNKRIRVLAVPGPAPADGPVHVASAPAVSVASRASADAMKRGCRRR